MTPDEIHRQLGLFALHLLGSKPEGAITWETVQRDLWSLRVYASERLRIGSQARTEAEDEIERYRQMIVLASREDK